MKKTCYALLHDGVAVVWCLMIILIIPAMKHYHQEYNAVVAFITIPLAYASCVALITAFLLVLEEQSLLYARDGAVTFFVVAMIISVVPWILKVLNLTVCPAINWLSGLV